MIYSCLAKKDWRISKPNEKEEFICSSDFGDKKVLPYRRRKIVIKQPNLLKKIEILYKLENRNIVQIKDLHYVFNYKPSI